MTRLVSSQSYRTLLKTSLHTGILGRAMATAPSAAQSTAVPKTAIIYRNGKYENPPAPWGNFHDHGVMDILKWRWSKDSALDVHAGVHFDADLPLVAPQWASGTSDTLTWTWIGHATGVIQLGTANILIDPQFSDRCAPVQFAGPKRFRPVPVGLDQLPAIDLIAISHNHFDHLDYNSCLALSKSQPNAHWVVGEGNDAWLRKHIPAIPPSHIHSVRWWDEVKLELPAQTITVTSTPAQHWSTRSPFSKCTTLWCGFVFASDTRKVYFSGDTAYCQGLKEIGHHLGPMDLSILPIGAYEPNWFMKYSHVNPEEAVQIHEDVRSKRSVAVHWGTFTLSDEPTMAPKQQLAAEVQRRGWDASVFTTTRHGETIILQ